MATTNLPSNADTAAILDTLMYVNEFPKNGTSLEDVLEHQAAHYSTLDKEQRESFKCVYRYVYGTDFHAPPVDVPGIKEFQSALQGPNPTENFQMTENGHPDILKYEYGGHSDNTSMTGAVAASFYTKDDSGHVENLVVAYRGTGAGRWYDNGDAFSKVSSPYQEQSAAYFDSIARELNIDQSTNVMVTGHSKGGNNAQYTTLFSENAGLIDSCLSLDGQGFSPEAIARIKELRGEQYFQDQCQKMYSISGDDDPVNVLGIKVIPEDHTTYVVTQKNGHISDYTADGIAGVHSPTWLYNYKDGSFYETTTTQRELAVFAKTLNDYIMSLPPEQREDVCRSVMSYIEAVTKGDGLTVGLNGEQATIEEQLGLWSHLDSVVAELVYTPEGQAFINKAINDNIKKKISDTFNVDDDDVLGKIVVAVIAGYAQNRLTGAIAVTEGMIVFLSEAISKTARVADGFRMAYEFCCTVGAGLKELWDKYHQSQEEKAAQEYLSYATVIRLHTDDLHNLAERLWDVNGRLESLDHRLDNLYKRVKWTDLWNLMRADFKIGWSPKINSCANCLNDTANRFESAEQQILGLMG